VTSNDPFAPFCITLTTQRFPSFTHYQFLVYPRTYSHDKLSILKLYRTRNAAYSASDALKAAHLWKCLPDDTRKENVSVGVCDKDVNRMDGTQGLGAIS